GGCNAQGHARLSLIEPEYPGTGGSGSHRAKQPWRMKSAQVTARRGAAETPLQLPANDVRLNEPGARRARHFTQGQARRQHSRSAMGRRLPLDLEIQAVQKDPVGKGCRRGIGLHIVPHDTALRPSPKLLYV